MNAFGESTFMQRIHSFVGSEKVPQLTFNLCIVATTATVFLSTYFFFLGTFRSRYCQHQTPSKGARKGRLIRKQAFLEGCGDKYGYRSSAKGFIDEWRLREFPDLIAPYEATSWWRLRSHQMNSKRKQTDLISSYDQEPMVYLDYAGAALPTSSQLKSTFHVNSRILANPHSMGGPASTRSWTTIQQAKRQVLQHFDASRDYEFIFTSGTTDALRFLAESFPWSEASGSQVSGHKGSNFVYAHNSHTSVIGIRAPAMARGAQFQCVPLHQLEQDGGLKHLFRLTAGIRPSGCQTNHLCALPLECNFGGYRANVINAVKACRDLQAQQDGADSWFCLVDIAKAASSGPVSLPDLGLPDFACVSFYKMFGLPTGLGGLFVKRSSLSMLKTSNELTRYFGGGSVEIVLPYENHHHPRSDVHHQGGSCHFRGIASLCFGFEELKSLGGMEAIRSHTMALATEFVLRMKALEHSNSTPVVRLYGLWATANFETLHSRLGPTVAFNVVRDDGTFVGYSEVLKLATLHTPPLQLRIGCHCNPGACQSALGLTDEQVLQNYEDFGHVCGDHIDIIDGKPTGVVRISFGKDNLWEDLDTFLEFMEETFVSTRTELTDTDKERPHPSLQENVRDVVVSEMYIYPIKSCSAQGVSSWPLTKKGQLLYDREFALVEFASGSAMRLQYYPQMTRIKPRIDMERGQLIVSAAGMDDMIVSLSENCSNVDDDWREDEIVKVCGEECNARSWGGSQVSEWFSNCLGIQCYLARQMVEDSKSTDRVHSRRSGVAFSNEESLLLVSSPAVDRLNSILAQRGQPPVRTKHFRPNIVVTFRDETGDPFLSNQLEDNLKELTMAMPYIKLNVVGECARCSMVDFDPESGLKGKTLGALATYRRRKGRIAFGVFLRRSDGSSEGVIWLSEGASLRCGY